MVFRFPLFIFILFINHAIAQQGQFAMKHLTEEQRLMQAPYCVSNTTEVKNLLAQKNIAIKFETSRWLFITATANEILSFYENEEIPDYYLEINPPALLNDSARARHFVDQVHNGIGLTSSFRGNGILMGYVDTGVEVYHPDFQNANGSSRILRYWDQTTNVGSTLSTYGYGIIWDSTQINASLCTSTDATGHGSTVTGAGSGNGNSTGYNHGMAPECDIIMVESNFNAPNWTLTVADACDYIFKVADSLGKPAVINLSAGTYFGSHDGSDPASEFIEGLLDAQKGRVVVSAAGNSANLPRYHCDADMTSDTTFVWFNNNTNGAYGANTIFFDLWSDSTEATFDYMFRAVRQASNYATRGSTIYRNATSSLGVPVFDTIRNTNGQRIATLEIYTGYEDGNYHMQGFVSKLDSTSYKIGFYTTGSGSYDLWSGASFGYNSIITSLPTVANFPSIVNYNAPDSLQTIVSSWNCSEKVISVGNVKNRTSFPTLAGGTYTPTDNIPVGKLSINSSKGPSRVDITKPDIAASGDVMLSAAPLAYLANPSNWNKIDTGGWHMGNGGTSMSSPVVAGIAALFLERCTEANYQDFKNELLASAMPNTYTGILPNYAYGFGLANAHDLLLANEFEIEVDGPLGFCVDPITLSLNSTQTLSTAEWSTGNIGMTQNVSAPMTIYASGFNLNGCKSYSDTASIVQFEVPTIDPIVMTVDNAELSTLSSTNYQWTANGNDIPGETASTLLVGEPFGTYTCYAVSVDGCVTETAPFTLTSGIEEFSSAQISIYPNPTNGKIRLKTDLIINKVLLFDAVGKEIMVNLNAFNEVDLSNFSQGIYTLVISTNSGEFQTKVIRQSY